VDARSLSFLNYCGILGLLDGEDMQRMLIYMDSCCFSRPCDDLSDDAVRLESEAVLTIISRSEQQNWGLYGSDVLVDEIERMTDKVKKDKVMALYSASSGHIEINDTIIERAKGLIAIRIKPFDALHIACAEFGKADVFLTTDRRLINATKRMAVNVRVANPAIWLMEVLFR
jgi:predicted nucleic acid-binding protein